MNNKNTKHKEIRKWKERHDINLNDTSAIAAFEDAETLFHCVDNIQSQDQKVIEILQERCRAYHLAIHQSNKLLTSALQLEDIGLSSAIDKGSPEIGAQILASSLYSPENEHEDYVREYERLLPIIRFWRSLH